MVGMLIFLHGCGYFLIPLNENWEIKEKMMKNKNKSF